MDGQEVGILSVRARVKEKLRLRQLPVVLVTDKDTRAQAIMAVIDECTAAGAKKISMAAEKQ